MNLQFLSDIFGYVGGECLASEVNIDQGAYRGLPYDPENPIMLGDKIPKDTVIEFVCDPGYYLTKGYRAACKEGNWLGDTRAECEREYSNIFSPQWEFDKAMLLLVENKTTLFKQNSFILIMMS